MLARRHVGSELADQRRRSREHRGQNHVVRREDRLRLPRCAHEAAEADGDAQRLLARHPAELLGERLGARRVELRAEHAAARLLQEEGDERPVAQEVAAEALIDRRGDLLHLVAETLQGARCRVHRIAHARIHGDARDRFGEDADAQTAGLRAHHHPDGGQVGGAMHALSLREVVRGVAHRARHHSLRDKVDGESIEFGDIDEPAT